MELFTGWPSKGKHFEKLSDPNLVLTSVALQFPKIAQGTCTAVSVIKRYKTDLEQKVPLKGNTVFCSTQKRLGGKAQSCSVEDHID